MPRPLLPMLCLALALGCGSSSGTAPSQPPVDAALPTCTLVSPAPFASGLTGSLPMTATATDDVAVTAVEFQLDGAPLATVAAAPYAFTLPGTGAYASGQHVVRARSLDGAGNASPWSQAVVTFGGAVALPTGFSLTTLPGALTQATALAALPDGRVLVCEQGGALRLFKGGTLLPTPFAVLPTSVDGERGLLGVTPDPAFTGNGFVYVYYTAATPAAHNRISRLTADPVNPDQMLAGSEVSLVDLPALSVFNYHNGGGLHFGPDGKLYVGVGENGDASNAPSLATPLGKLLRFNADGTIPADNPFYGATTGLARAIWALGLRNPYTFAFQPGGTRLFIDDVGNSTWEEINLGSAGANYGWPATEGPTTAAGVTGPLFAYGHLSTPTGQPASTGTFLQGRAILGAAFDPPGSTWPAAYLGSYFFCDYTGGWVARMHLATGLVSTFATGLPTLSGLAFASDGALLVLAQGTLYRITAP